jgi:iron complex transport system permease protein
MYRDPTNRCTTYLPRLAIVVVVADTAGRIILSSTEVPSGIMTALLGTSYFLWLMWRSRNMA